MNDSDAIPELSLDEAWQLLASDPDSVLIDVRTMAEWSFVGVPKLDELGKGLRSVEWSRFPSGDVNPDFVEQAGQGLQTDQAILLVCRSGVRSLSAARSLRAAGFKRTYNVAAGFEGELGGDEHRHDGWKDHLPWRQG